MKNVKALRQHEPYASTENELKEILRYKMVPRPTLELQQHYLHYMLFKISCLRVTRKKEI